MRRLQSTQKNKIAEYVRGCAYVGVTELRSIDEVDSLVIQFFASLGFGLIVASCGSSRHNGVALFRGPAGIATVVLQVFRSFRKDGSVSLED